MREPTRKELLKELAELRLRLEEAEDTLSAIRHGEVDALVVSGPEGDRVFTLKGADHSYRVLVETINEGAATLSRDGKILYANRRLADLLETPLEKVIGSSMPDYVTSQDRSWFEALLQLRQEDNRGEARLMAAGGREVPTFLSVSLLPLEDAPDKLCLVVTDLTEQKRQEAILAAGRLSRAILEQAEQAIVVLNDQGVITQASQAAQRLRGGNPLLQNFAEAFPLRLQVKGDGTNFQEDVFPLTGVLQGVIYQGVEAVLPRRDGQELHVLLNAGPLLDESGAVRGGIVSLTDITARKRAEEELRAAHEQIAALVEESPLAIVVLDREARVRQWNPAAERLFGWRAEEVLGQPYPLIPEKEWPEFWHYFRRELEGLRHTSLEQRRQRRDGKFIDISLYTSPLHNAEGEVVGVMGILEDITARKQAEEALRTRVQVLKSMAEGVTVTDHRGYILYTNPAFDAMFGYEPGELMGRHSSTLNHYAPEENLRVVKEIVGQVHGTGAWFGEFHNRRKDGQPFFTSARVSALEVGGKHLFISVQEDITERKQREEMLRRQAELLDLAQDAILVRDMRGRITYWNRGATDLYGWSSEEAMGQVVHQLLATEYPEPLTAIETQVMERGRWEGEVIHTTRDGRRLLMDCRWSLKRDEQGRPLAILNINHDVTARRQAEEALRKSEQRFRKLVEANIIGIAVSDEETVVEANDAFLGMLGYSREEMYEGKINWVELTPHEYLPQDAQALYELRTSGAHTPFEKAFFCRDGSQVPVMVGGALLEEEPLIWVSFILDITERKQLEEALRQSEARFRAIFSNASIGIATTDLKGHFQQFNAPVVRGLGYTPTELQNMTFFEVTHPDDLEKDAELFTELAAGRRERYQVEKRYIRKDGRVLWGRLHVSLARNQAGEPEFAVSLVEDITARQEAQAALAESEARYRSLVEMSPDAIVVHARGRVVFANPAGLKLFRAASPEEILGQHIFDLVHPDFQDIVKQRVQRAYAGERVDLRELKIRRFDGQFADVETAATPITFQGRPAVQVVVRDITERKRAEAETQRLHNIVQSEREKLTALVNSISDEVWFADTQKKFTLANPAALQQFGLDSSEEIDVEKFAASLEVYYADGSPRPIEESPPLRALQGEPIRNLEEIIRTPASGELRYRQVSSSPVRDGSGNIIGSVSVVRDVTERKEAEEALRQSEARYRAIGELIPYGIWTAGVDGGIEYMSRSFLKMTGKTLEECRGFGWLHLLPYEDIEPTMKAWQYCLETGGFWDHEYKVRGRDGYYRTILSRGLPLADPQGRITSWVGINLDITERKEIEDALRRSQVELEDRVAQRTAALRLANEELWGEMAERRRVEHRLRESEARFTAFMQYLPGAAVMRDIQGRYIFANETWEALTGKKREQWQGKRVDDVWPPLQAKRFKDLDFQILSTGQPTEDLEELEWPEGRHYYLTYRFPIPDESGLPYMVGLIAVDITARKQAEMAAARQAAIVAGMNRILREALTSETEEELGRTCLAVVEELTESLFGFIDEINEQGTIDALAFSDPGWEMCRISPVEGLTHLKNIQPKGLLANSIQGGGVLLTNDPPSHPDAAGIPEGHPPLTAYLGLPLTYGDRTIGLLGLGNKAGGYTDADRETVEILGPAMVEALLHHRSAKELQKSESKLRFLADQLLTAQENERKRLASELHDELGHALLAMKLALRSIGKELLPTQEDLKEELRDQLDYIDEVIGEVRRLYHDLSPGDVEDLGLTKALRTLIADFSDLQEGIAWEVDLADLDGLFPLSVQTIIYRLVQEALTNIGKHAAPDEVKISAAPEDARVRFVIQDDGAGFNTSEVLHSAGGLGLVAMEERLNMVGGTFEVWSKPQKGTKIAFSIPMRQEGEEEGA
jgi:PAS domain S-box-containing protein